MSTSANRKPSPDLGNGQKRAIDTQVYDTFEIERISGVAFELARTRANKVCSMEKRNVMKSGVLWNEVVTATHQAKYPDVELTHMLADAAACSSSAGPSSSTSSSTDNLFGDMLSDVAAMLNRFARHAAVGLARRARCQERRPQGALRARPRFGTRHRGPGQSPIRSP